MNKDITIVAYHHISDDGSKLTKHLGVSTAPELFKKHVEYFASNYNLISGADLLANDLPNKALLLTFDDAYRSVLDVAAPILKAANFPSLFFINPGIVTAEVLPLDNLLSFAVEELTLDRVLVLLNQNHSNIRSLSQLINRIIPIMNPADLEFGKQRIYTELKVTEIELYRASNLFLKEHDIKKLLSCGVDIGNHSMNHKFFRTLSEDQLRTEVVHSKAELQRLSGQSIRFLSIPYGNRKDATSPALAIARASGHEALFLATARSNRFRNSKDIFDRVSLGNESLVALPFKLHAFPLMRCFRDAISQGERPS